MIFPPTFNEDLLYTEHCVGTEDTSVIFTPASVNQETDNNRNKSPNSSSSAHGARLILASPDLGMSTCLQTVENTSTSLRLTYFAWP